MQHHPQSITLAPGQVYAIDGAAGRTIRASFGIVWVTEEGDTGDFIVRPGEPRVVRSPGRTLVQALQSASVSIQ
jgi:hypothetical protein